MPPPLRMAIQRSHAFLAVKTGEVVKKSTDLHSDWISSQILLTSRVPASALSTPPFQQSRHGSFLGSCSDLFGTVQNTAMTRTYPANTLPEPSKYSIYFNLIFNHPEKLIGNMWAFTSRSQPTLLARKINSVATILCTITFVPKEASNDPLLTVRKYSAREK